MNKKNSPKILLVDDDRDMCESLADVLMIGSTYIVKFTTEPLKALKMAQSEDFSLIILDYKMPKINGLELMKSIIQVKPASVIFILTAFISNELINQAEKEGATRVLSKFLWPDDILQHVRETIG